MSDEKPGAAWDVLVTLNGGAALTFDCDEETGERLQDELAEARSRLVIARTDGGLIRLELAQTAAVRVVRRPG